MSSNSSTVPSREHAMKTKPVILKRTGLFPCRQKRLRPSRGDGGIRGKGVSSSGEKIVLTASRLPETSIALRSTETSAVLRSPKTVLKLSCPLEVAPA